MVSGFLIGNLYNVGISEMIGYCIRFIFNGIVMDKKLSEALYKVQALINEKMLKGEMSDYNKLKEIEKLLVELIQDECRKNFKK